MVVSSSMMLLISNVSLGLCICPKKSVMSSSGVTSLLSKYDESLESDLGSEILAASFVLGFFERSSLSSSKLFSSESKKSEDGISSSGKGTDATSDGFSDFFLFVTRCSVRLPEELILGRNEKLGDVDIITLTNKKYLFKIERISITHNNYQYEPG